MKSAVTAAVVAAVAAAGLALREVYEYARGFVESGPLFELLEVGRHEIRNPANGGVLRTVSADGFVAHGLNLSAVVIDELHAWTTGKQHELFDAPDTAVHKRPGAFWLVITTAGHDRSRSWVGSTRPCWRRSNSTRSPGSWSAAASSTVCCCTGTGRPEAATPTTRGCGGA